MPTATAPATLKIEVGISTEKAIQLLDLVEKATATSKAHLSALEDLGKALLDGGLCLQNCADPGKTFKLSTL